MLDFSYRCINSFGILIREVFNIREILFRGKRVDNGEWVEGNLFMPDAVTHRKAPTEILVGTNVVRISYEVIPETVGQYTGLLDKNGTKIFEGDIVEIVTVDTKEKRKFVVEIGECLETNEEVCCYAVYHRFFGAAITLPINHIDLTEVIGNIHDNTEPPEEE